MNVAFWFDPVCPFCWMTSRWIDSIAAERDLDIDWQPISLLFKNDMEPGHPFYERASRTRDLLRVIESVRDAGFTNRVGDLYTEFGRRIHNDETPEFEVGPVLVQLGIDASHADALSDARFDVAIRERMAVGLELTGPDVGTPLIAIDRSDGERVGFFGPVLTKFPQPDAAVALWDGFVAMANDDGFFELKRTRTSAPDLPPVSAFNSN